MLSGPQLEKRILLTTAEAQTYAFLSNNVESIKILIIQLFFSFKVIQQEQWNGNKNIYLTNCKYQHTF